jgi:hypothetical protein
LTDADAAKQLDHIALSNQLRAANHEKDAGENELRAFERDQLTSATPLYQRFWLLSDAAQSAAGKTFAEAIQGADDNCEKKCVQNARFIEHLSSLHAPLFGARSDCASSPFIPLAL